MRSLQTKGEVRLDERKRNILRRSPGSWPSPTLGQAARRRFWLANYANPLQFWAAKDGYLANAGEIVGQLRHACVPQIEGAADREIVGHRHGMPASVLYCGSALAYSMQRHQRRQTGVLRMSKNINSLQYGRALAALAVLANHSCLATAAFVERPPHLLEAVFGRDFDFFFVLSGFITMHAHMNDARTGQAAALYIKKRLRRIYIPYLPVSFCLILLYLAFPSISMGNRDWGVLTSITLFPTARPPALSVAWTLIHQMMFYTLFLASYFTKRFIIFIFAWVVAIVGAWSVGWTPDFPVLRIFLSPLNLEFVAGMASAYAYPRVSVRWWPALIGAGLASIAAYFVAFEAEPHHVWFGISLAPIVIGVALLERLKAPAPLGWLLMLGNASYAIYLVHNPIVSIAARLSMGLHSWGLSLMLCMIAGTVFGVAYHFLVEKPGIRMTNKLAWA